MAIETATTSSTTQIDPTVQPFLKYGLEESQRLYQAGGLSFSQVKVMSALHRLPKQV